MPDYNPGDITRVSTTPGFTNAAGALTDPTTVTLRWRVAGGVQTLWTWTAGAPGTDIVRESVGLFRADIRPVVAGLHYFRWTGTGAIEAAEEGTFSVGTMFP